MHARAFDRKIKESKQARKKVTKAQCSPMQSVKFRSKRQKSLKDKKENLSPIPASDSKQWEIEVLRHE